MKDLLIATLTILIIDLLFSGCANPVSPTGGPKDSIPPCLINSHPLTGSTNFKEQEITLDFSEYINADKLTQNLVITPRTDIKYKHLIKKNQLSIKFETSFADSTTFSLNFFDGVTDITERNPAINLVLAFSTGNFIDSMSISGTVKDLLTQEPKGKFLVGLYPLSDTLDFFSDSPLYFTTSNDSGTFDINYIKSNAYRILSFNDANKNLLLDPSEEEHGFLVDTIELTTSKTKIQLRTLLQDIKPIALVNNRPIGNYHEIKYNKRIDTYKILPDSIHSSLSGENQDVIRLYYNELFNYGDSIPLIVTTSDSLTNTTSDTLKIVFLQSNRKSQELITSISYTEKMLVDNPTYQLSFSKPISTVIPENIIYKADTIFQYIPDSLHMNWNSNKTKLDLTTFLSKEVLFDKLDLQFREDSLAQGTSSLVLPPDTTSQHNSRKRAPIRKPKLELETLRGAFISIEGDSSDTQTIQHQRKTKNSFGTLKLQIETSYPSFIVQLLSNSGEVKYQVTDNKSPTFDVVPNTYNVRILIDTDGDGTWSYGNLLRHQEPENVYLFPDEIPVRENWIVEDYIIRF